MRAREAVICRGHELEREVGRLWSELGVDEEFARGGLNSSDLKSAQIVPRYTGEISLARFRGSMISVDMICLGSESVLAYAVDAILAHVPHGWRYMVGLGAVPSTLLGIFVF